jgi:hypothetical protein
MNGGVFSAGQWRGRLVAGLLLWAAPGRADDFIFSTNADNTITLTAYNGEGGNVIVPSRVNELPVVEIGPSAFMGCRTVTDIDLPGSMLRIGRNAFMACTNLRHVHSGRGEFDRRRILQLVQPNDGYRRGYEQC